MRVLIISSWNTPCGIAEHTKMLREAVQLADPGIEVIPCSEALDPAQLLPETRLPALLHLNLHDKPAEVLVHVNHHDGLHSRWTPEYIQALRDRGLPVVITYHDTYDGTRSPNSEKAKALLPIASAMIVHEPVDDLPGALYWRQGVPRPAANPLRYFSRWAEVRESPDHRAPGFKAFPQQPVLGTMGFNFPWKNFDRLAKETAEAGWAIVILSTNATREDGERWRKLNPHCHVEIGHMATEEVINFLAGCDATAFMYECHNTGTSAAVRQGIAARKPVLALKECRQFRDLLIADNQYARPHMHLSWCDDWADFRSQLCYIAPAQWDPLISEVAERDSWAKVGKAYAQLYRSLVTA